MDEDQSSRISGPSPRIWILFLSVLAAPFVLLILALVSAILINNFKAHQALSDLRKLPLPPEARVVDERGIVGRFLGETGNYTEIVAYRVFVTDLSESEIRHFYIERPDLFLTARNVDTPFQELFKLGEKRCVVPLELAVAKVPDNERDRAYVLASAYRAGEAILDIRGY